MEGEAGFVALLANHLGEIIVGIVLGAFGLAFQSWGRSLRTTTESVRRSSDIILSKLENLIKDFHNHRVEIEGRVTRVETKVELERLERLARVQEQQRSK